MKRILSLLICIVLCFALFSGCDPTSVSTGDVVITAGELVPGMTFDEVEVYVTVNGNPIACTPEWIYYTETDYGYMQGSDTIPENFWGRLDLTYTLPKGMLYDNCSFTAKTPGGIYDGTGDIGTNESSQLVAWSHIQYDFRSGNCPVVITIDELVPGMTFDQIGATVTVNGQQTPVELGWCFFSPDGVGELTGSEIIPEIFFGRVDLSYYLPTGIALEDIAVTVNAPGGTYDGTGNIAPDKDGQVAAWSHVLYNNTLFGDVVITVGEVQTGMQVGSIPVSVTANGTNVPCQVTWIRFSADDYSYLSAEDVIPKNFDGRLDVTYDLPLGMTWDNIEVSVNAPGGTYDGTGDASSAGSFYFTAWSHIMYNNSSQSSTSSAAPATPTPTEPLPTEPAPTTPPATQHTHDWVHNSSQPATCTQSGQTEFHCSGCSETYREETAPLGHDFALVTYVSGSCSTGVTWDKVCSRCGQAESYTTAPTNHTWGNGTYLNGRLHQLTCSVCGDVTESAHTCNQDALCSGCGQYIIN